MREVFRRLRKANLQVNATKSNFCARETEFLGFVLSQQGIKPQPKKVDAILRLAPPKNVHQVRSFVGMLNHYKQMIPRRSHLLTPLVALTAKNSKFKWTETEQNAFNALKAAIAKQVVLAYPDFSKPFEIYTDASQHQLGSVIMQSDRILAFYSRKLTDAQTRYTVGERELLSIVETLKEFRTILLGHLITIYTDHKNLTFDNSSTDRVRRWRLIIEEYGPKIIYIKGVKNVIADALSRLPKSDRNIDEDFLVQECFATPETEDFPLSYANISAHQLNDAALQAKVEENPTSYEIRILQGNSLIYYNNRIVVPSTLRRPIMDWYHTFLLHPGRERLYQSLRPHFIWRSMYADINTFVRDCPTCQKYKRQKKSYGQLPVKQHDPHPWHTVAVDLIGPWTVPQPKDDAKSQSIELLALTIIDPSTNYLNIVALPNKESRTVAEAFDQAWLCCYPRPLECIHDNGREFVGIEFQELLQSYGIKSVLTTVHNPQANSVIERVHQVIANLLRSQNLMRQDLSTRENQQKILAPVTWAFNTTYHTSLQASPAQLVFGRDMIMPTTFLANWAAIQHRRQIRTNRDTERENSVRIPHEYRVNDKVLIKRDIAQLGKLARPTEGPFTIIDVSTVKVNGTVVIDRGNSIERINIRRLVPYFQRYN